MHINRLVECFLREKGIAPTKLGRLVARDPRLVLDMRMGREFRHEMETKIRRYIAANAPQLESGKDQPA